MKTHIIFDNTDISEYDDFDFLDERTNLDIQLNENIVAIADVGRWNGRFSGYQLIDSGNIKDCLDFRSCDFGKWWVDERGNFRSELHHHDGTHRVLYRAFKEGVSEEQIENFCDKIYNSKLTQADVSRYTRRLGDDIAEVYGFEIPKPKTADIER